jgi:3',5'-cyclic-nucleotide phosphodiesterase
MSEFKIAQITDLHLTPEGAQPAQNQKIDPYLKLNTIFRDIRMMTDKPDMIAITGDLIHGGHESDYEKLSKVLSHHMDKLNIPINVILGNHDNTGDFFSGFLKQHQRDKYYYSLPTKATDFYFLDSTFHNFEEGYLGEDQLIWLRDNLVDTPEKEAIIFLHHPIDGPGLHHMRYSILQESSELMDIIKDSNVKAVFGGHVHFETSFIRSGILFHSADSSAYHINCDNEHKHLIYDATNYDIITIDNGEIGVESRSLFSGQDIIEHIDIEDTGFVNQNIFG